MSELTENTGLINNGDGITFKFVMTVIETTFFNSLYAIQNAVNEAKVYRKNYVSTGLYTALEYCQIIPFLVHGNNVP